MSASFTLNMYTPDATLYSGEVSSLVVPAMDGYLGVLAHHAPLIAALAEGRITVKNAGGDVKIFQIHGTGCLEISGNEATILLERTD